MVLRSARGKKGSPGDGLVLPSTAGHTAVGVSACPSGANAVILEPLMRLSA